MPHFTHVYRGHHNWVGCLSWSLDSARIVSGSSDGTAQVWEVSSGEPLVMYRGHQGRVYSVAWSPNGRWIASGGEDKTVRVWDALNGEARLIYQGTGLGCQYR